MSDWQWVGIGICLAVMGLHLIRLIRSGEHL